jgi:hypothetical protein
MPPTASVVTRLHHYTNTLIFFQIGQQTVSGLQVDGIAYPSYPLSGDTVLG